MTMTSNRHHRIISTCLQMKSRNISLIVLLLSLKTRAFYIMVKILLACVFYWFAYCLDIEIFCHQGDGRYNNPVYLGLVKKALCEKKGITCLFPHWFCPMFPIPAMSIVAAMVSDPTHRFEYLFIFCVQRSKLSLRSSSQANISASS